MGAARHLQRAALDRSAAHAAAVTRALGHRLLLLVPSHVAGGAPPAPAAPPPPREGGGGAGTPAAAPRADTRRSAGRSIHPARRGARRPRPGDGRRAGRLRDPRPASGGGPPRRSPPAAPRALRAGTAARRPRSLLNHRPPDRPGPRRAFPQDRSEER